jgi:hypothetical protein
MTPQTLRPARVQGYRNIRKSGVDPRAALRPEATP